MRRIILALAGLLTLASPALAVNTSVPGMTAGAAVSGTDVWYCAQSGGTVDRKCTTTQIDTFINAQFSGDLTVTAGGVVTLKNTGPGATGPLGSATVAPIVTIDAQGRVTALTSATVTPAVGSITGFGTGVATFLATPTSANLAAAMTDETGTGANVFGTAPTISSPTINTAATFGFLTSAGTQCLQVSSVGAVSGTGSACGGSGSTGANPTATAGPTAVNGVSPNFMRADAAPAIQLGTAAQAGLLQPDGSTIKVAAGVISAPPAVTSRTVTGATDTILAADLGNIVYYNSASAIAVNQPAPSGSFAAGFFTTLCNINAGVPTVTAGSGLIGGSGGASTYALPIVGTATSPKCVSYQSDGTNFNLIPSAINSFAGTATLGTSAIASGACATVVTVSAPGVLTTDIVTAGYNSDPTAVTGYGASATGAVLTVYPYPTANNMNVKVCNSTGSSITPGALTVNLSVKR